MSAGRSTSTHFYLIAIAVISAVVLGVHFLFNTDESVRRAYAHNVPGEQHDHRHFTIAVTCPFGPFFDNGNGNGEGIEWSLITRTFAQLGLAAQPIYLHYDEAVAAFSINLVQSVWLCGGMTRPEGEYFYSEPLLPRHFVAVTLKDRDMPVDDIDELVYLKSGIHPDAFLALDPWSALTVLSSPGLIQVTNHVLLEAMLFSGRIDVLIMEKSVFDYYLRKVPSLAKPEQTVTIHEVFEPVYPVLMFKEADIRDKFDAHWRSLATTTSLE